MVQCGVGFAVVLPLAAAFEPMHLHLTASLALSLAYLVLANSIVAITLLLAMIRVGEASRVSALFFLVPPIAALLAWAVLGEIAGAGGLGRARGVGGGRRDRDAGAASPRRRATDARVTSVASGRGRGQHAAATNGGAR